MADVDVEFVWLHEAKPMLDFRPKTLMCYSFDLTQSSLKQCISLFGTGVSPFHT